ncbi:signal peptidase II [Patescibacteria group bacterium]|nr:signal peptidase II [Patescibacteria group bacterium]MBU1757615.1 signal peptidase II [Patescibacteria group bacterium]
MPVIMTMVLSIVALVAFIICFYRGYLSVIITSLLVAGTLGNLIDRTLLGGVRDFLDIGIFNFPIFNGADLFLNI